MILSRDFFGKIQLALAKLTKIKIRQFAFILLKENLQRLKLLGAKKTEVIK